MYMNYVWTGTYMFLKPPEIHLMIVVQSSCKYFSVAIVPGHLLKSYRHSLKMHAVWNVEVKKWQTEALIPSYAKKFKISQWIAKNFWNHSSSV